MSRQKEVYDRLGAMGISGLLSNRQLCLAGDSENGRGNSRLVSDGPSSVFRATKGQDNSVTIDAKDINAALQHLMLRVYSPISGKQVLFQFSIFLIGFLGVWPGREYASDFADKFSQYIFKTAEGESWHIWGGYVSFAYMMANEAITMRSATLTAKSFYRQFKRTEVYKAWMRKNDEFVKCGFVPVELVQAVISVVLTALAMFAVDEQNKDPDVANSYSKVVFDWVCRCLGDASTAMQLLRSFNITMDSVPDIKAALAGPQGLKCRREIFSLKCDLLSRVNGLRGIENQFSPHHCVTLAEGYDNRAQPWLSPIFFGVLGCFVLDDYSRVNYGNAADEELKGNQVAGGLSLIARWGMWVLMTRATGDQLTRYANTIVSKMTGTPLVHSSAVTAKKFALEIAVAGVCITAPSMFAAAGRFARFYPFELDSQSAVWRAFANAMRAAGINYGDLVASVESGWEGRAQLSNADWAKKIKYGENFEALLLKLTKSMTDDMFVAPLARPKEVCIEEREQLLATDSESLDIEVPMVIPRTSLAALIVSCFHSRPPECELRVTDSGRDLLNALEILRFAKEKGVDLESHFDFASQHMGEDPNSLEYSEALSTLGRHQFGHNTNLV